MKYKLGDRVKILETAEDEYTLSLMEDCLGKIGIIEAIGYEDDGTPYYGVRMENLYNVMFYWYDYHLELVSAGA